MDLRFILLIFAFIYFVSLTMSAPMDKKLAPHSSIPGASENEIEENVVEGVKDDKKVDAEIDELGLEYGRYLQEVVKALDEDPEFSKKLENITHDQIMSGHVARHIESVAPDVRNRLDELKRIELDRLRKLAMKEHNLEEEMAREQHDGNDGNELDGRRWRTVHGGSQGTNTKNIPANLLDDKNAAHVDHGNPHTFEAEDLQKLIMQATKDLEELDQKRRRDFKQYEMEKEIHYQDELKNMTGDARVEAEKKHNEEKQKHNNHPHVNHPGSKHQFEEVWEQQDHMAKQEFDPKIFFQMHDVNGDGFLDQEEVEALLGIEVKKLYNEKDPSYDRNEMIEEYHRMREHIYKEIDANHDGLISRKEFLDYTKSQEFEKDEGWKGIEEAPVYTNEELKHYEQQRQALQDHYAKYGAYQMPYQPYEVDPYGQPVYYMQHPNGGAMGGHPNQPVQYVQMAPEHIQHPAQMQHVELPPQHYVNGQLQHPQQYQQQQYQQLPPGQHPQQQQYMQNTPQIAALPPANQQQHPGQMQQQHPGMVPQQQQVYNQGPPMQQQQQQQMHPGQGQPMYQQAPMQAVPVQQQHPSQMPQGHYAVPPAQVHQQQQQQAQQQQQQQPNLAVPNTNSQQQQQQQHPNNPNQHH